MKDMFTVLTMSDGIETESGGMVVRSDGAATMEGLFEHTRNSLMSREMCENGKVMFFGAWPNAIPAEPEGR